MRRRSQRQRQRPHRRACRDARRRIFLTQGDRRYRVRGLNKNMSYELLRVNVLVSARTPRGESAFHVDTLDLYSARQRSVFTKQAAEELGIKEEVSAATWAACC